MICIQLKIIVMKLVAQITYYDGDIKKITKLCENAGFEVKIALALS